MTSFEWFEIGLCTGLVLAYAVVRLGRRHRDRSQSAPPANGDTR